MYGNAENCIENVCLKTNCSDHLEYLFADENIILKLILSDNVDWFQWLRMVSFLGFCACCKELHI
jgi:hypothetical protein